MSLGRELHSRYPYADAAGLQSIAAFRVESDGSLTTITVTGGLEFGAQGIERDKVTAERTLEGVEAMHMMRKGQVKWLAVVTYESR